MLADGQVGYLEIDGFSSSSARRLRGAAARAARDARRPALRRSTCGTTRAASWTPRSTIASQFVADGPDLLGGVRPTARQVAHDAQRGRRRHRPRDPVVVLVNGGSAQRQRDRRRCAPGHGPGDARRARRRSARAPIQQWHLLPGDSGGFRLSVAKWLTPDQTWIHGTGMTPDVVVAASDRRAERDAQLDRALGSAARSAPRPDRRHAGVPRRVRRLRHGSAIDAGWPRRALHAVSVDYVRERKEVMCSDRQ